MDNWLETKNLQVHFVSAAGVVFREGKVLMIRSERRGWEFPGGVVEQGEAILDGLKREILEESGITAEPECVTGIYQNIVKKKGYGPLEGMDLPTTVNMVFRCRYVGGTETVTEERRLRNRSGKQRQGNGKGYGHEHTGRSGAESGISLCGRSLARGAGIEDHL